MIKFSLFVCCNYFLIPLFRYTKKELRIRFISVYEYFLMSFFLYNIRSSSNYKLKFTVFCELSSICTNAVVKDTVFPFIAHNFTMKLVSLTSTLFQKTKHIIIVWHIRPLNRKIVGATWCGLVSACVIII